MWCSDVEGMFTGSKLNRLLLRKLFQDTLGGSSPSADGTRLECRRNLTVRTCESFIKAENLPQNPQISFLLYWDELNTAVLENARLCPCALSLRGEFYWCQSAFKQPAKCFPPKTRPHTSLHFYLYEDFHTHSAFPFEHLTLNLTCNPVIILPFSGHLPSQSQTYTGTFGGHQLGLLLDFPHVNCCRTFELTIEYYIFWVVFDDLPPRKRVKGLFL